MPILDNVRRLAIWGFGREGRAVYDFLRAEYPAIALTILNDGPLADATDVPLLIGDAAKSAVYDGGFDIIVKSPGISRQEPREYVSIHRTTGKAHASARHRPAGPFAQEHVGSPVSPRRPRTEVGPSP